MTCRALFLFITIFVLSFNSFGQRKKILFIPLDDRPPCLQFTEKMGLIGLTDVISPPRELLGKFTTAGDPDKIIEWVTRQNLETFDAAIISIDMLAYGGLVASRLYKSSLNEALTRVTIINDIRGKAPALPIFGQSVIMRLAPTSDGKNEAYREKLARWAYISPYKEHYNESKKLEAEIPAEALENYKHARQRNLAVNQQAIRLVQDNILDYLILSQDDAKPRGVHVADREILISETGKKALKEKVIVQPGTDEISMLLLARALNKNYKFSPKVFVKYSSEMAADSAMPFEDRPLRKTVGYNIIAAGAEETYNEHLADLIFYVFTSRFQKGKAETFASDIDKNIAEGKHIMIADVDPKGNTQGGDSLFTKALLKLKVFTEVYSYASWNTAGNTIGTTLPQGLIFHLAKEKLMETSDQRMGIWSAQNWFTLHRLLDDYAFHTIVRPKANEFFRQSNRSGFERTEVIAGQVEKFSNDLLQPMYKELSAIHSEKRPDSMQNHINCVPGLMTFSLPWNRTFEGEMEFNMNCW
jgi:hypothetical protein